MNKVFSNGHRIVTGYRNSKNYGTNWISSGYALWFIRESKYLNNSRMLCNTSCAIGGTGFLVHREVLLNSDGWKFFFLTEDIQFTVHNILEGESIAYCNEAVLYDEQPTTFAQSWKQRMRWAKGFIQVSKKYKTTFHSFGTKTDITIDYIFATDGLDKKATSCTLWEHEKNGIFLSDHYPVCAEFDLD